MVRTSLRRGERLNLLGALLVTPRARQLKLAVQSHRRNLTGEEVIAFLQHVLRRVRGPIVLLWDNHPIHQRKQVQEFIVGHRRVHGYNFPTCAPELNPVEFVWNQVAEYTAGTAPHDRYELRANVSAGIARTRNSQKRLWACITGSDLPWR